jgi:hypothetical protein
MAKVLQYYQEWWDDGVESSGVTAQVKAHALCVFFDDVTSEQVKEWHYFGTTQAEKPPTTADIVVEHPAFQYPIDLAAMPQGTGIFAAMAAENLFRKLAE